MYSKATCNDNNIIMKYRGVLKVINNYQSMSSRFQYSQELNHPAKFLNVTHHVKDQVTIH